MNAKFKQALEQITKRYRTTNVKKPTVQCCWDCGMKVGEEHAVHCTTQLSVKYPTRVQSIHTDVQWFEL